MGRLEGKVALVTGAASGIGRAAARTFVAEGARVVVADINLGGVSKIAEELGEVAQAVLLDVSNEEHWDAATALAVNKFGKLDIVANIAGISVGGTIEDITAEDWKRTVDVNLTGVLWGCKYGVRVISSSGGSGAIINVSSIGGLIGAADLAGYCAAKGGVTVLSKSVALHCAEKSLPIRCISIHPTYVDSEMLDQFATAFSDRDTMIRGMGRLVPMGRIATPYDVANAILFAASDEAAMISGSGIVIDGAQLAGPRSAHS